MPCRTWFGCLVAGCFLPANIQIQSSLSACFRTRPGAFSKNLPIATILSSIQPFFALVRAPNMP